MRKVKNGPPAGTTVTPVLPQIFIPVGFWLGIEYADPAANCPTTPPILTSDSAPVMERNILGMVGPQGKGIFVLVFRGRRPLMVTFKLYLCLKRTPVEFVSGWETVLMHAFNDIRGNRVD